MLVQHVPTDVLLALHHATNGQLGALIVTCVEAGLEPDLVVDLGGANSATLLLSGLDRVGVIRFWRDWSIPTSDEPATIAALRLRLETTLESAHAFEAWVERAVADVGRGRAPPPRPGRKHTWPRIDRLSSLSTGRPAVAPDE